MITIISQLFFRKDIILSSLVFDSIFEDSALIFLSLYKRIQDSKIYFLPLTSRDKRRADRQGEHVVLSLVRSCFFR